MWQILGLWKWNCYIKTLWKRTCLRWLGFFEGKLCIPIFRRLWIQDWFGWVFILVSITLNMRTTAARINCIQIQETVHVWLALKVEKEIKVKSRAKQRRKECKTRRMCVESKAGVWRHEKMMHDVCLPEITLHYITYIFVSLDCLLRQSCSDSCHWLILDLLSFLTNIPHIINNRTSHLYSQLPSSLWYLRPPNQLPSLLFLLEWRGIQVWVSSWSCLW